MNREIKFRAFTDRMWQWEEIRKEFDVWTFSSDPLMQYTGLKDKNGVEIYDGDIVKINFTHASWWWYSNPQPTGRDGYASSTGICQVDYFGRAVKIKFLEKDFWFDRYPDLEDKINIHYLNTAILFNYKCEVIGNIYENPELIK